MNIKIIKIISSILAVAGVAINLASSVIGDKLLDDKINTKISEALKKD